MYYRREKGKEMKGEKRNEEGEAEREKEDGKGEVRLRIKEDKERK